MQNAAQKLLKLLTQPPLAWGEITREMKTWPCRNAVLFFYNNELLPPSILSSATIQQIWKTYREEEKIINNQNFQWQAQQNINDRVLMMGYHLYCMAKEAEEKEDRVTAAYYLQAAMHYNSFHAYQTRLHQLLMTANLSFLQKYDIIDQSLHNISAALILHFAPGSLLLMNGYWYLANLARKKKDTSKLLASYSGQWRYLVLAELLMKDSEPEINNAYFGEGLRLSNPYKEENLIKLKEKVLIDHADLMDERLQKKEAIKAQEIYSELMHRRKNKKWIKDIED